MSALAAWYLPILHTHVACVAASGTLFFGRGCLMLAGSPLANHPLARRVSQTVDTVLLVAAILLTMIIHQYPLVQAWLTTKVLLLVLYIALGVFALRRAPTRALRACCFVAALAVYLYIVAVAVAHSPRGPFALL
ncbi:MAG TPA: SirB2 family protein [Rhodanobacteraceae bacterium]|nr:SirB2 family protein [Rhodanobacteraceae bacterium]